MFVKSPASMPQSSIWQVGYRADILVPLVLCVLISCIWGMQQGLMVPLACASAPILSVIVIRQHSWFVLLFVVFSFFRLHEALPVLYPLRIPLLLSLAVISGALWHALISRQLQIYSQPSFKWLCLFWLIALISVPLASNRTIAFFFLSQFYWKIILMTLLIMWVCEAERFLRYTPILFILAGALVSCVAIDNVVNQVGLVEGNRVTIARSLGSMLGDPNDLSLVLLFPFAFVMTVLLESDHKLWLKVLVFIAGCLLLVALVHTRSRGGMLGLICVFAFAMLPKLKSKVGVLLLVILGSMVLYNVAGIADRPSGGIGQLTDDTSAMGRLYAWQAAWRMALHHPLFGVGLDNFYYNYYFYSDLWDGKNHSVHSTWFGVLAETGFLGLFAFIGFISALFVTIRKTLKQLQGCPQQNKHFWPLARAIYLGLIGTIMSGTFLTQGFNWPIYILAALTMSLSHIVSQQDEQSCA